MPKQSNKKQQQQQQQQQQACVFSSSVSSTLSSHHSDCEGWAKRRADGNTDACCSRRVLPSRSARAGRPGNHYHANNEETGDSCIRRRSRPAMFPSAPAQCPDPR
jgi:hypothetical protein